MLFHERIDGSPSSRAWSDVSKSALVYIIVVVTSRIMTAIFCSHGGA